MKRDHDAEERIAICVEAGVPEARAREIAECERVRRKAAEMRVAWRRECYAGHREVRV